MCLKFTAYQAKRAVSLLLFALCLSSSVHAQRFVKVVNTIDDLVRLNPNDVNTNVFVADLNRGGLFSLAARTSTNNGTAFASTNATKQWNRKYDDSINVKWYGADPSGVTNSTSAIQAAIDDAPAFTTILIPKGTYRITDNINLPRGDIRILNHGKIIQYTAGKGVFGNRNASTDTIYRVHIEGGSYSTASGVIGTNAFYLRNMGQALINFDNITTEGSATNSGFYYPVQTFGDTYPNGTYYTVVRGKSIFGHSAAGTWGVFTGGNGTNNGPNNCTFEIASIQMGLGSGVLITNSTCTTVQRTAVENSATGIRIASQYPLQNNVVRECRGEDNSSVDIVFSGGTTNNYSIHNDLNSGTKLQDFGKNWRTESPDLEVNNAELHDLFVYSTGGNEDQDIKLGTDPTRYWQWIAKAGMTNDIGLVVYDMWLTNSTFDGDIHLAIRTNNRVFVNGWNITPVGPHFATNHVLRGGVDPTRFFNVEYRAYNATNDTYDFVLHNTNYNSRAVLSNVWDQGSSYHLINGTWLRYGGGGFTDGQFLKRVGTNVTTGAIGTNDVADLQASLDAKQNAFTTGAGVTNISNVLSGNYNAGTNVFLTTNANGAVSISTSDTNKLDKSGVIMMWFAGSDETTALTTGDGKITLRAPRAFTVTSVRASLSTASSSGAVTVDINESGSTIFSTKVTIDQSEKTSTTAAASVLSDTSIADDAEITLDIDGAGTGAAGLKIEIYGTP